MSERVRKLIGGLGIMIFLAAYVWAVTAVADRLPDDAGLKLIFFGVCGVLWGAPILPLISWMNRSR